MLLALGCQTILGIEGREVRRNTDVPTHMEPDASGSVGGHGGASAGAAGSDAGLAGSANATGGSRTDVGGAAGGGAGGDTAELGFSIAASSVGVVLVQGSSVTIVVNATRTTDHGTLTLTAGDLPQGVTFVEGTMAADSTEGTITLSATSDAPQTSTAPLTLRATGMSGSASAEVDLLVRGPSGALDTTFGDAGFRALDISFAEHVPTATAGPRSVVVAGRSTSSLLVTGLTRVGTLDTSFGASGHLSFGTAGVATPPRLDGSNRWVMKYNGSFGGDNMAVRLTADGLFDDTFSDDGVLQLTARAGNHGGILPLAAGGYHVGSQTSAPMSADTHLVVSVDDAGTIVAEDATQYLVDGLPATSGHAASAILRTQTGTNLFCTVGDAGSRSCGYLPDDLHLGELIRLEHGRGNRTVVAFDSVVAQFRGNDLDADFGEDGRLGVQVPTATSPIVRGLAVLEMPGDGERPGNEEIYVLGDAEFEAERRLFVTKVDEAGELVPAFGLGGISVIDFPALDEEAGIQLWLEGDNIYLLFLSHDLGETASLRGKLHVARLWR